MKGIPLYGILTFYNVQNFGAVLQAFALQSVIQELGYDAEHIRFSDSLHAETAVSNIKRAHLALKSAGYHMYMYMKTRAYSHQEKELFSEFRKNHLKTSRLYHYTMDDLKNVSEEYAGFISGSDMVWTDIGQNMDMYFLTFTDYDKRISYAPSITGTSKYTEEQVKFISSRICNIKYLSVREKSGVQFIKKTTGRDAFWAVDPTLLMNKEEWKRKLKLNEGKSIEKYILIYMFQGSDSVIGSIRKIADENGYKIRCIPMTTKERYQDLKNRYSAAYGPKEFVELFMNASFAVTNSFHGLLFALIFNIPFLLIHRNEGNLWGEHEDRMHSILKLIGLEDRFIFACDRITKNHLTLDFNNVNVIMDEERRKSKEYLVNALEKTSRHEKHTLKEVKRVDELNHNLCTGCTACKFACAKQCITMRPNEEGFLYPIVNEKKCIHCGKCVYVCSGCIETDFLRPIRGLLGFSLDSMQKNSASGGAFVTLAKYFIEHLNGIVIGAAFEEKTLKCKHIFTDNISDLSRLQNSKYIQSEMDGVFEKVEILLKKGRYVLFSGTPCQVQGVKNYLGRTYDTLLTVDIICHGVPSPDLWKRNVEHISLRGGGRVVACSFRNKDHEEDARSAFQLKYYIATDRRGILALRNRNVKRAIHEDVYYNLFVKNGSFRQSCYYCKFARIERCGDITIGDCDSWRDYPEFYPEKAKSSILINTDKGEVFWNKVSGGFLSHKLDIAKEAKVNTPLSNPSPKPALRDNVYKDVRNMIWDDFVKKYAPKRTLASKAVEYIWYKIERRSK